jgi:succinate dehydrogenase/fumarate reductase flavoprotein subunit
VSGNALAETQVFGTLAGKSAAHFAGGRGIPETAGAAAAVEEVKEANRIWRTAKSPGVRPFQVRERLRETMWQTCGVERAAEALKQGRGDLEEIQRDLIPALRAHPGGDETIGSYPQELQDAWEAKMMAGLAELVLASALAREESRGHHNRLDFPETEKEPRHVFVSRKDGLRFGQVKRVSR